MARFCLRVAKLSQQVRYLFSLVTPQAAHMGIEHYIELIQISDRPDMRTKLGQALAGLSQRYALFLEHDGVDKESLRQVLDQIKIHQTFIQQRSRQLSQAINQSAFSGALMQNFLAPARLTDFSVPFLKTILCDFDQEVQKSLDDWFNQYKPYCDMVDFILMLLREDCERTDVITENGHYQLNLEPGDDVALVRVEVEEPGCYPSVSVGKHRLSINFFELSPRMQEQLSRQVSRPISCQIQIASL